MTAIRKPSQKTVQIRVGRDLFGVFVVHILTVSLAQRPPTLERLRSLTFALDLIGSCVV